jgi:hypothetical protein
VNGILEWVNKDLAKLGIEPMRGVDNEWLERYDHFINDMKKRKAFGAEIDKTAKTTTEGFFVVGVASA